MGFNSAIPRGRFSPRSIGTRFAYRFLRALKKLNMRRTATSKEMMVTRRRRYHMVKTAAHASMASAVGSKRAWSRAMLRKMRNNKNRGGLVKRRKTHRRATVLKKRSRRSIVSNGDQEENPSAISKEYLGVEQLQKLVPGGEAMELWELLDETAHYMKCLTSQVQVMTTILHLYSGS